MHPKFTPRQAEIFWAHVDKSGDCWLWDGPRKDEGYGRFFWWDGERNRREAAHRLAWELLRGPIPKGLFVCHDCPGGDNPRCVNPAHMFLGTQLDNIRDMMRKGRHGSQVDPERYRAARMKCGSHLPHYRGEECAYAKVTEAQVVEIRYLYAAGGITHRQLAKRFGLGKTTVGHILHGRKWAHADGPIAPIAPEHIPQKLTAEQVREIRARYVPRLVDGPQLAREYGVSTPVIYAILRRHIWQQVD